MGFETAGRAGANKVTSWCGCGFRICLRVVAGVVTLAVVAAGLLYLRLLQGPIDLAPLARATAAMVNAELDTARVEIGGAVLTLNTGSAHCGIEFTDVRVFATDGTKILAAPVLSAGFHTWDLLMGELKPTRMEVIGAQARVVRDRQGLIRFGLGTGPGVEMGGSAPDVTPGPDRAATDAVAKIIRGFVGDTEPLPLLERLVHVGVIGAEVTYADGVTRRRWRTRGSDLTIRRTASGARAIMNAAVSARAELPTRLRIRAERLAGTGRTDFRIAFSKLRPGDLAAQAPSLGWTRLIDAPLAGEIRLSILADGTFGPAEGTLRATRGRLLALPPTLREFDRMALSFAAPLGAERVSLRRAEIEGPALAARVSGALRVEGADPFHAEALAAQLHLHGARLAMPERFDAPLEIESGQIVARLSTDPWEVELGHAHLVEAGGVVLAASGRARPGPEGWEAALRATARGMAVSDLKRLWPKGLGENARRWVAENLLTGRITDLVAQIGLRAGDPVLALDFRFEDVASRYLGPMPPIRGGAGTGHLTAERFDLLLSRGRVEVPEGGTVALSDSRLTVTGFADPVTPADIRLAGEGPTAAFLALIDQPPLGLVSKLGLDLGRVGGRSEVTADLAFPLDADLAIEDIEVASAARLRDVAAEIVLGEVPLAVSAATLALRSTEVELALTGRVSVEGAPLEVDWEERYGDRPGRSFRVSGSVPHSALARRGAAPPGFVGGAAEIELSLEANGGPARLEGRVDLARAELALPEIAWRKDAGRPGRLTLAARLGSGLEVDRFDLAAAGLEVSGRLALDGQSELVSAELDRLRLGERADLSARILRAADGAIEARLRGRSLDLEEALAEGPGDGPPPPLGRAVRVTAEIDRVRVSDGIGLAGVVAQFVESREGGRTLELDASAEGVPIRARYARRPGKQGSLRLTAEDAGQFLRAIGLFSGGQGGTLLLDTVLEDGQGLALSGQAEIRDIRVTGATGVGTILEEGGAEEAARAVAEAGGVEFDTVMIPFRYRPGRVTLRPSIARSNALAVKIEGEVDQDADRLALSGVISPGYGVTGALDEVPILGRLLSGGRGEGIFAMTFQITGSLEDPTIEVNPLSILTPGILRGVFSGKASRPSQSFLDQLGPTE